MTLRRGGTEILGKRRNVSGTCSSFALQAALGGASERREMTPPVPESPAGVVGTTHVRLFPPENSVGCASPNTPGLQCSGASTSPQWGRGQGPPLRRAGAPEQNPELQEAADFRGVRGGCRGDGTDPSDLACAPRPRPWRGQQAPFSSRPRRKLASL